jgi:hypothetical protein
MAFLADSPTSTMSPICVNTLLSPPLSHARHGGQQAHGHDEDDGIGRVRLSYCAASTRKTSRMAMGNTSTAELPARISW